MLFLQTEQVITIFDVQDLEKSTSEKLHFTNNYSTDIADSEMSPNAGKAYYKNPYIDEIDEFKKLYCTEKVYHKNGTTSDMLNYEKKKTQ